MNINSGAIKTGVNVLVSIIECEAGISVCVPDLVTVQITKLLITFKTKRS